MRGGKVRDLAMGGMFADVPSYPYDVHAFWLRTPHLPMKVRMAVDALAAALPKLM